MADKTPIRGAYSGASLTGLAEYATGDTIGVSFGGTGLATVGSNQLLTGSGTGALTSESSLTFDGTTLATTAFTATGNVSLDGGTFVFNESGADKDFRVEGDSEANLLMIDASTDRIGIGTATPSHLVDIEGVGHAATCFVSADLCATTKVVSPALCIGSQYALPAADGSAGQIMCTDGSGAIVFATASAGVTLAGSTNNTIATVTGANALAGEANLTFDGTDLAIGNAAPSSYMNSVHGLIIGDTSDATSEIVIATNGSGTAEINFTDTADTTNQASIFYTHSSANFDFKTTQSGGLFKFSPDTGGSVLMQIGDASSNPRVGINTTSPDHQFEVENTTAGSGAGVNYYAGNFKTTLATYNIQAEGTHGGVTGTAIESYQNSSSPADGDFAGAYGVSYKDSGGNRVQAGSFGWFVTDVTAGTIDTYFYLRVISNSSAVAGTLSTAGVWTDSSAAANKEYYGTRQEVWPDGVLGSLKTLNVSKYKPANQPEDKPVTETHVSPTAEDFWDTFQIGQDPRREVLNAEGEQILNPSIAPKDLSGVALVAIQELLERVEAAEAKIAVLESA